jgi:hypothetical protein
VQCSLQDGKGTTADTHAMKLRRDTENSLTRLLLILASAEVEYQLAGCLRQGGKIRENLITDGLQRNKKGQSTLGRHLSMNSNLGNVSAGIQRHKE